MQKSYVTYPITQEDLTEDCYFPQVRQGESLVSQAVFSKESLSLR